MHVHLIPIESGDDLKRHQDMTAAIDHERLASTAAALRLA